MCRTVTFEIDLTPEEKETFVQTAEALGLTPSEVLRVFIRAFNEAGGFPFDVRRDPEIDFGHPKLFRPRVEGETVVLPASWRDADGEDE